MSRSTTGFGSCSHPVFEIERTTIPGCALLKPVVRADSRGRFVKTVHASWFAAHGLDAAFREQFYSVSGARVLRGLHFQVPPHDQAKLVYCPVGRILDAVVDLRVGSPTYGRHEVFELDGDRGFAVFIPQGLAHGFYTLADPALVIYSVTCEHSPQHDRGVLWSSAGIPWPATDPIISARDAAFPALSDFHSPFRYEEHPV